MPTELLNGVRLHYDITGTGDTVVLTHGSWGDGAGWQPTVDILSRTHRVVTWDRRGHSRSDEGDGPGSILQDVDDLTALIESVADGPVHAVGNSYGAVITYALTASRPDYVRTAAVHEPPVLGLLQESTDPDIQAVANPFFEHLNTVQSLLEQGKYREAPQHFIDHIAFEPGTWDSMPEESKQVLAGNAPTFLDELQGHPYGDVDLDALTDAGVPLLLTVGTASPRFLTLIVELLDDLVPPIHVETIEGAGHVPHGTHPDALCEVLLDFWKEIG